MGYACHYIWRCYAILVRHSVILGMLYILVLCYLLCNIGYCGRFIDVVFRKCFGFEFEFRAFGLRNWERVLRKMFWFGDLVFNALDMEDYEDGIEM